MWSGWAEDLVRRLEQATGRDDLAMPLFEMLGYDPGTRQARPGGGLISTPMARLHDLTLAVLLAQEVRTDTAERAMAAAWHAPDPVALAHPLVDLPPFLTALRVRGRKLAIATSDDRDPTDRTLVALGIKELLDGVVCADDGVANKPAPDPVLHLCAALGVPPSRTAVVGDSPADIAMGRRAGAALVVGVRTGIGADADLEGADLVVDSVAAFA
jgi:phosphoglycolate phosphatase